MRGEEYAFVRIHVDEVKDPKYKEIEELSAKSWRGRRTPGGLWLPINSNTTHGDRRVRGLE